MILSFLTCNEVMNKLLNTSNSFRTSSNKNGKKNIRLNPEHVVSAIDILHKDNCGEISDKTIWTDKIIEEIKI